MESVEQFFKRSDLRQIRHFLIHGVDNINGEPDPQTYDERIINDSKDILELLEKLSPDEDTLEQALDALDTALRAYQEVYSEAGLKAGARLLVQLITNDNTDNYR